MHLKLKARNFESEFSYKTSRSSGPGGQNVNKLNTRVELRFDVAGSLLLRENEKKKIKSKLGNRINSKGELLITSQSERSQLKNKQAANERFYQLLTLALQPVKKRKATRPTRSSVEKRLDKKRKISEKKSLRRSEC